MKLGVLYVISIGLGLFQTVGIPFWARHVTGLTGDALFIRAVWLTLGFAAIASVVAIWGVALGVRRETWETVPIVLINAVTMLWILPRLQWGI